MQQCQRIGTPACEHALRQLQHQSLRVELRRLQRLAQHVHEVAVHHLPRREIHGDRHRLLAWRHRPLRCRQRGRLQHPGPDLDDGARLLGQWNELAWRHEAAVRVLPAHQCLGADDLLRAQFHDRLKDQRQFLPLERLAQVGLQLDAIQHRRMHAAFIQHRARLAACLGVIHRHVGVAQHLVSRLLRLRTRDADARAQVHVLAFHLQRTAQRRRDARRHVHHLTFATHLFQQDRELVATEARRGVTVAKAGAQPVRRLHQHGITRGMAQRIVDLLEVVQVEEDHGHFVVRALGAAKPVCHAILKQRAIAKPRQRIMQRLVSKMFLQRDTLRHVADREHDAVDVRVGEQVRRNGFGAHPFTVDADHAAPDVAQRRAAHQGRGEVCLVRGAVRLVHQLGQCVIHHPFTGRAEHTLRRWTDVTDDAQRIQDREHVRRVLHQRTVSRLRLLHRPLHVEPHVLAHHGDLPAHDQHGEHDRADDEVGDVCRSAQRHGEEQAIPQRDGHVRHDAEARTQHDPAPRRHGALRICPAHAGAKRDEQVTTDAQHVDDRCHLKWIGQARCAPADVGQE